MRRKISQKEARETRRELDALKYALRHGGRRIDTINVSNTEACIAETAHTLDHIVVARVQGNSQLTMHAIKP